MLPNKFKRVVLPQPEVPKIAIYSPDLTVKVTPKIMILINYL
jgi:hypothetical protein